MLRLEPRPVKTMPFLIRTCLPFMVLYKTSWTLVTGADDVDKGALVLMMWDFTKSSDVKHISLSFCDRWS